MKIIQIVDNICYYDATPVHPTLVSTVGRYPPDVLFVEAPDNVFEGWGYDPDAEGDARFVQPTPPEGWLYDARTGTFYPEDEPAPVLAPTLEEQLAALTATLAESEVARKAQQEQLTEQADALIELAGLVAGEEV